MGKKGKGRKGSKGSSKSGKGKGQLENKKSTVPKIDDTTKQFYLWQIKILEDKVWKYQKQNDELVVASTQFNEKLDQCMTDKNDIINFWKYQLEMKANAYNDLNDKYTTLKQILDNEQEQCRKQMMQIRREADENQSQIVAENLLLNSKLMALEEFRLQRDSLLSKLESLEEELATKNEEYTESIANMERKLVCDKERLKSEMIARIKKVAGEFRKVTDKTLNTTIKRALNENIMVSAQLAKMSDKTVELIEENDKQNTVSSKLEQKIILLESNEKELSARYQDSLKLMNKLREQCFSQQEQITQLKGQYAMHRGDETECSRLQVEVMVLKKDIDQLTKRVNDLVHENVELRLNSLTDTETREENEYLFTNAVDTLKESVMMLVPSDERYTPDCEKIQHNMLESLVVLMKSSQAMGIKMAKRDVLPTEQISLTFVPNRKTVTHQSVAEKQAREKKDGRYILGDLGLTPRADQILATPRQKMKNTAKLSELAPLRGVLCKSLGTQTANAPTAIVYSQQMRGSIPEYKLYSKVQESQVQELHRPPTGSAPRPTPTKFLNSRF
ncbi:cilia- and flagella-associated protein 157-like [Physella acuta]|uniref:cilia- and flagella-associated protein 157-like n=1 Tax=Physella acuta TaxID=109671 RepID=UPI0027DBCFAC|nr:cilia- and flagella-associated protein 157-like [Physella acuta]